jgi:uncharacterized membrane protein YfcA
MEWFLESLPLVAVLCTGVFVQSAAGFAAGLIIIPSLLWFGYSIPAANFALLIASIPQNIWGVWSFREAISSKDVTWPAIARLIFFPVGISVVYQLEALDTQTLRQLVGAILILLTTSIALFRPQPRQELHAAWAWVAFPLSGFMQGVVGMGGPAMVFWVQAHDWGTRRSRGFLFAMYLTSLVPALLILAFAFGSSVLNAGLVTAFSIPLLLWVTQLGLKFGTKLGRKLLKRVTLILLMLMGIAGLVSPWILSNG